MKGRYFTVRPEPKPGDFQSLERVRREISKAWKTDGDVHSSPWRQALCSRRVWNRALVIGVTVGILQAVINQGDHWLNHAVDRVVIIKTIACPVVAIAVAFFAAASTHVANLKVIKK